MTEDLRSFVESFFPIETVARLVECENVSVSEQVVATIRMIWFTTEEPRTLTNIVEQECVLVAEAEMSQVRELLSSRIAALRDDECVEVMPSDFFAPPEVSDATDEYLRHNIHFRVCSGYGTCAEVLESLEQLVFESIQNPTEAVLQKYRDIADEEFRELAEAARAWPPQTTNDRLTLAFETLRTRGVIAIENAGWTQSDGWSLVREQQNEADAAWACTFFHSQDLERGVRGEGLLIAFGPLDASEETFDEQTRRAAQLICGVLGDYGVDARWSGSLDERIEIPPFEWRRRRENQP